MQMFGNYHSHYSFEEATMGYSQKQQVKKLRGESA
jgi:hypothetical protein